jgi:hypothetical protein
VKIGKLSMNVSWFKYLRKIIVNDRKEERYKSQDQNRVGWMNWTNASGINDGRNIPFNLKRKFTVQL